MLATFFVIAGPVTRQAPAAVPRGPTADDPARAQGAPMHLTGCVGCAAEMERREQAAVEAVLDALLAAARDIAGGGWIDVDGETGSEWCHWCQTMPDYPKGKPVERHTDSCELVALRDALATITEAE